MTKTAFQLRLRFANVRTARNPGLFGPYLDEYRSDSDKSGTVEKRRLSLWSTVKVSSGSDRYRSRYARTEFGVEISTGRRPDGDSIRGAATESIGLILCYAAFAGPHLDRYRSDPDEAFTVEKLRVVSQRCTICLDSIDIGQDTDETNPKLKFGLVGFGPDALPPGRGPLSDPDPARRNFDFGFVSFVFRLISTGFRQIGHR